MLLARVEGHVTATRKHPSFAGWRLILCQPIGREGQPEAAPLVALDALGAGLHQRVILSSDGLAARRAVGDDKSPARWMIIGIVDEVTPGTNALEDAAGGRSPASPVTPPVPARQP
jgi:microcompartment protein CcmK/EutM